MKSKPSAAVDRIDTRATGTGIQPYPLEFSGSGPEFFRVWIVNLLLTIVTLGFYTPFARKRTAQYFYGHTLVANSPLEFTAQQRKMVFGFLLLVVLYVAFKLLAETGQDTWAALFLFTGAALAPYFWASAMRFRLGATRWRGVRLQFAAGWGEVYKASWPVFAAAVVWIGVVASLQMLAPGARASGAGIGRHLLIVALLVLGVALILTLLCVIRLEYNYKALLVSRAYAGAQPGRWKPVYGDFVRIWLATLGVLAGGALAFALVASAAIASGVAFAPAKRDGLAVVLAIVAGLLAILFAIVVVTSPARAYREARMFQLVWNNVGVSTIARFKCNLRARRYVLLRMKNMVLTMLTLGFYRPFARVSEYRMKTESVTLHVKGGLDQLVGMLAQQQDGLGDALADAVGLDLIG
ncbi:YjgN family protein [Caenimonas aquaedulcis]|uniref:DUF898 domain-containing protein n=1 Tax=Caenimonas aquaedulcis TaxID=2793270 RepID=A0A931H749_9BURK|nr:YjgN family protein [Caenimonas aquaedulcis]MBG9389909.1 DUF898 domain-containing protein [Caenimonas aquaedulcis]